VLGSLQRNYKTPLGISISLPKTLDVVFQKLFSTKYSSSSTKESPDFWGAHKYSKYESQRQEKLHSHLRRKICSHTLRILGIETKRVLVGFTDVMGTGPSAASHFNGWRGGGGNGDDELQTLYSL
jgi:hypothetical protein